MTNGNESNATNELQIGMPLCRRQDLNIGTKRASCRFTSSATAHYCVFILSSKAPSQNWNFIWLSRHAKHLSTGTNHGCCLPSLLRFLAQRLAAKACTSVSDPAVCGQNPAETAWACYKSGTDQIKHFHPARKSLWIKAWLHEFSETRKQHVLCQRICIRTSTQ